MITDSDCHRVDALLQPTGASLQCRLHSPQGVHEFSRVHRRSIITHALLTRDDLPTPAVHLSIPTLFSVAEVFILLVRCPTRNGAESQQAADAQSDHRPYIVI